MLCAVRECFLCDFRQHFIYAYERLMQYGNMLKKVVGKNGQITFLAFIKLFVCVCLCVFACVCVCVCFWLCVLIYVCLCVFVFFLIIHINVCVCVCLCAYVSDWGCYASFNHLINQYHVTIMSQTHHVVSNSTESWEKQQTKHVWKHIYEWRWIACSSHMYIRDCPYYIISHMKRTSPTSISIHLDPVLQ